jgi:hypothetical protein
MPFPFPPSYRILFFADLTSDSKLCGRGDYAKHAVAPAHEETLPTADTR